MSTAAEKRGRRECLTLVWILISFVAVITLFSLGGTWYTYGQDHPFTPLDLEIARNHSLVMCDQTSCLTNCSIFNQVVLTFSDQRDNLNYYCVSQCTTIREPTTCSPSQMSVCIDECQARFQKLFEIESSSLAEDGREKKENGRRLLIAGGCMIAMGYIGVGLLIQYHDRCIKNEVVPEPASDS